METVIIEPQTITYYLQNSEILFREGDLCPFCHSVLVDGGYETDSNACIATDILDCEQCGISFFGDEWLCGD
jgi:hypothetical protein